MLLRLHVQGQERIPRRISGRNRVALHPASIGVLEEVDLGIDSGIHIAARQAKDILVVVVLLLFFFALAAHLRKEVAGGTGPRIVTTRAVGGVEG